MTKQNFTLYAYKKDKRTKSGEKLVSTQVITDTNEIEMAGVAKMGKLLQPDYRFEYFPTMVTVKNLMTGADVQIDRDTPWCCNPASESYWTM